MGVGGTPLMCMRTLIEAIVKLVFTCLLLTPKDGGNGKENGNKRCAVKDCE